MPPNIQKDKSGIALCSTSNKCILVFKVILANILNLTSRGHAHFVCNGFSIFPISKTKFQKLITKCTICTNSLPATM